VFLQKQYKKFNVKKVWVGLMDKSENNKTAKLKFLWLSSQLIRKQVFKKLIGIIFWILLFRIQLKYSILIR
jgi:hypothetical protein